MSCLCDQHRCPSPFGIPAGLSALPRAPGMFADWRIGLLAAVGREKHLDDWRAREPGDLGVMLVEMCAYVLDVASFYDQRVAEGSYLGTATLVGGTRRHVSLLGYLPRPAFGASAWLAAEADGVRTIAMPAGTAIRSGAFGSEPPQIFELQTDAIVEPRVNRLTIDRVPATLLPSPLAGLSVRTGTVRARAGDLVVLSAGDSLQTGRVSGTSRLQLRIRQPVSRIDFTAPFTPPAGATYAGARLLKGGAKCGAWKRSPVAGETAVLSGAQLSLDGRVPLQPGDIVAFEADGVSAARRIVSVSDEHYVIIPSMPSTITHPDNKTSTLNSPPIKIGVTRITVDSPLPFAAADVARLVVHYAMSDAATLHAPLKDTLEQTDPIVVPGLIDPPRTEITDIALEDVHGDGAVTTGALDAAVHSVDPADSPTWQLWAPVQLHGNVFLATRGESVRGELLGVGDAGQQLQSFRLKKKPLTYLPAANAANRRSSLVIHVGGILWDEAESFYGAGDGDTVYIVRHDDEGNTDVAFGGGARLPTGARVVADYRFGAGAAAPPADSVKQVARPVAGLRRIRNVLPAFGGADAEGPAELAVRGPASALLLGRAISLTDIETAAAQQPGVRAARAAWRWDELGQRPAAIVSYIGDPQLAPGIQAALRALAEDGAPIGAYSATAQYARLEAEVAIDPRRVPADVVAAVSRALFGAVTLPGTGGILRPERLGPDTVLFASAVVRTIAEVPGVAALLALDFDETPFVETGRVPAAGAYFDFAAGGVWVNGQRAM